MNKFALKRFDYSLRPLRSYDKMLPGESTSEFVSFFKNKRIGKNQHALFYAGIPRQRDIYKQPLGKTKRYSKYFNHKGIIYKADGVWQKLKESRYVPQSTRYTMKGQMNIKPIMKTKTLVRALAGSGTAIAIGALGAKLLKNKKKEKEAS